MSQLQRITSAKVMPLPGPDHIQELADAGICRMSRVGTTLKAPGAIELPAGLAEAVTGPHSCSTSPAVHLLPALPFHRYSLSAHRHSLRMIYTLGEKNSVLPKEIPSDIAHV